MKKILFSVFILMFLIAIPVNAKSYGWGFSRNDNNQPPDIGSYEDEIKGTSSYYVGNPNEKTVYLTFDAGYDNGNMIKILDILQEKNVKSTFFVTGDFLTRESELLKQIVNRGHIVGNHTWGHKDITKLSEQQLSEQIIKFENEYQNLIGSPLIKYFRPPAGQFDKQSLEIVSGLGYTTFFWSIAFKDWENSNLGAEYSFNSVMDNIHSGAIILLHTVSNDNVSALPQIIDQIRADGYTIKNLDYLKSSESSTF